MGVLLNPQKLWRGLESNEGALEPNEGALELKMIGTH